MIYFPLYEKILSISKEYPDKIAVQDKKMQLTYCQLIEKIDKLANLLVSLGIDNGDKVGLYMRNSIDYIVSLLSCIKMGIVYVPIPYTDPETRITEMINKSKPKAIVCKDFERCSFIYSKFPDIQFIFHSEGQEIMKDARVFLVNDFDQKTSCQPYLHKPDDLCYIIFTSGSTGNPKGVMISATSLDNYIAETIKCFSLNQETISLIISPFHFDGSFGSIYCTLMAGGKMVLEETDLLLPRVFGKTLMREKITHMTCSPSFLTFISEGIKNGAELFLKTIGIGGEDCSVKSAMLFMEKFPNTRLINRYGPTETTVVVSSFEINQDRIRRCPKIPIGKPHKNIKFYVVDSSANVVEKGKEGELYISGIQLMQGYCGDERLTQKVLRNDVIKGITTYKTGDIVTTDLEGNYYYLDRVDNMVNRYGNRIYLSEIEHILQGMEIVNEVCCLADKTKDPVTINVFLCLNSEIPDNKLREEIIKILPKNMCPDRIIVLERIPINNKHKIDTESLMHKVKEMECPKCSH